MNRDRSLLFTPRPQAGESPLSMLRRGALGNGHTSTLRFAFALNPSLDHSPTALGTLARNPELFRSTCQEMGLSRAEIDQISYRRAGAAREDDLVWHELRVGVGDLQFDRAKICMACYQEQGYALAEWDHVAAVACVRHGVLLDDACPCCSDPWTHVRDPRACGCDPAAVALAQQPCPSGPASLLRQIIDAADQKGLHLLSLIWSVIRWWSLLGMKLSRMVIAESLYAMWSGRWPELPAAGPMEGEIPVHPRIALAPLLASTLPGHVAHAARLLGAPAPEFLIPPGCRMNMSEIRAMKVLGIGTVPFEKLVADGHLYRNREGRVPVRDVNALLQLVSPSNQPDQTGASLAILRAGQRRRSLSSLICEIKRGDLRPVECPVGRGLDGLKCSPIPNQPKAGLRGLITIADAADHLCTNTESVRGVIRAGWLIAEQGTPDSGVRWNIDPRGLDAFNEKYVFASALATRYSAPRTTLSSRLRSAGLVPVSGPGIDGGVTFLFRREDLARIELPAILTAPYKSPAGRKKKAAVAIQPSVIAGSEVASVLGISSRRIGDVVREGWIRPQEPQARKWMFDQAKSEALGQRLEVAFRDLESAASVTGQTVHAFRRTWIGTGFVKARRFAGRELISVRDMGRIEAAWKEMATCSAIGTALGRTRSLCPNLQKMGQLEPVTVLGTGRKKIRLYPRVAAPLDRFRTERT